MSSRQYLINAATKHQIFLQRYGAGVFKQLLPFIKDLQQQIRELVKSASTDWSKKRLKLFYDELDTINTIFTKNIKKSTQTQALALAKYESEFTAKITKQAIALPAALAKNNKKVLPGDVTVFNFTMPTVSQLKSVAFTSIMDSRPGFKNTTGLTIGDALENFGTSKAAQATKIIRSGFALGQTNQEINKNLAPVLDNLIPRQLESLTRTITNHIASQSKAEFFKQNDDLIEGYQVVATLDDRTTLTCAALDGKIFTPDEFEAPPYHYGCRTAYIAVLKKEFNLTGALGGDRSAKGANGVERGLSTQTTYNSWLKTQPEAFRQEVLGVERAKLFDQGVSLDKFVDSNFKPLTLKELEQLDIKHSVSK